MSLQFWAGQGQKEEQGNTIMFKSPWSVLVNFSCKSSGLAQAAHAPPPAKVNGRTNEAAREEEPEHRTAGLCGPWNSGVGLMLFYHGLEMLNKF